MKTDVKIQINSLEALERLIGNDSQLETELRSSIVQNFTTKHLRHIANESLFKKTQEALAKEIEELFFDKVKTVYSHRLEFKGDAREKIIQLIKNYIDDTIIKMAYEVVQTTNMRESLSNALEAAVFRIENELSDKVVEEKLNKLVDQRIKEKLGLK